MENSSASSNNITKQNTDPSSENRDKDSTHKLFIISRCKRIKEITDSNANTGDNQETSEESEAEERLLAVYSRSGRLGAAYYTLQTGELYVLEETVDRPPEHQVFMSLFRQVEPVMVLVDGKTQGTLVSTVKSVVFNETNQDGRCKLIFISSKEYSYEACRRRVLSLSLPHEPSGCSDEDRAMFLRTAVDFAQVQSIHALGALLRYLDLNWSKLSLSMHGTPQFLCLKRISLADMVWMDEDTYRGLQVFSSQPHPSAFKRGALGSSREGLSLYQLLGKCASRVGHARLRVLLRHPSSDIKTLQRRLDVVEFFTKPLNDSLMRNICSSLRFIKNVNGILAKIKALSAKPFQWKSLYNTLYHAVLICELCERAGSTSELLQQLACSDNRNLYEMALCMNRIIDFELSKTEGKFTVKAGVDSDLDIKKQTMASLHGLMSETAKVELERLPSFIEECTMLYMPHLGYLLGVKAWDDNLTMEQKELPNMKFMFQNNDYIHYKNKGCEELDVMIGDTYPEVVAHETRIMMRLTAVIMENLHTLAAVIDKCAELDCFIAIAKVSKEFNFVRPKLSNDKVIKIKQGKHPLYITSCDHLVPNDVDSSSEAGFVKILTGPNASGKSVYLKQTGLIVYMAHIGSFVPAESAEIGVVNHIYSRIQSTECVAAHMSAFLIDLRQMALAIRECGSRSLVIVDEFGKGTSETDGLCLLAACLNTLLYRAELCPHLLLATHFLSIKDFIIDTPLVRFQRLEHVIRGGEPVLLYRVVDGSAECSFAHHAAGAAGLSRLLPRAETVAICAQNNTLPPPDSKIQAKIRSAIEKIKNDLLHEDI
ncbi:mutS protein homolog 5-like [Battus philenor]|uniref:mutS protein homolog 5-like n=1 Tax=Battus philenor TaxID=42288 RepID=UPI0035D0DEA6